MPEAVYLDLWGRHYRAELPVRGVSFECEQIEKPPEGLHSLRSYVAKDIINHPLTSVKWFSDEAPAVT